jgi:hypothetical protein
MVGYGNVTKMGSQNAWRYRVQKRSVVTRLVHAVNGYIRNSVRLPQFIKVCRALEIKAQRPFPLTQRSAYHAGFFDADGHISLFF